jgi:hypothetical protein
VCYVKRVCIKQKQKRSYQQVNVKEGKEERKKRKKVGWIKKGFECLGIKRERKTEKIQKGQFKQNSIQFSNSEVPRTQVPVIPPKDISIQKR